MNLNIIKLFIKSDMIIPKDYYLKLIDEIAYSYDIKLNIISFEDNDNLKGAYYPNTNSLKVNYDIVVNSNKSNTYKNVELIKTIYHELTHYVQIRELLSDDKKDIEEVFSCYYDLIKKGLYDNSLNSELYKHCHDNYIFEYQANLFSNLKTAEFMEKLNLNKLANKLYIKSAKFILNEYNNGFYPITKNIFTFNYMDALKENKQQTFFKDSDCIDEYARLVFGYSLSDDALNYIEKVANKEEQAIRFQKKL